MALTDQSIYCVDTPLGELVIDVPESIAMGLRATMKGVVVSKVGLVSAKPVVEISYAQNRFNIFRPRTRFEANYSDFVDCLNEALLQLAYEMMSFLSGWQMLHCSAVQLNGSNSIAFGKKQAGKSVWAFESTLKGGMLLADDLLAWNRELSRFICFGQSSRLRRPVNLKVFDYLNETAFIPGASLSYIKHTHLNIAPCGYQFEPDYIVDIEVDTYLARKLSVRESYERLIKGCIPAESFYPL